MLKSLQILHNKIDLNVGFSYDTICDNLPNSTLLKQNALFNAIKNNKLLLSHQTSKIKQIKSSKKINPGWGCLGEVLYTTPIYINGSSIERDNFFNLVLSHQKNKTKELIIKVNTKNEPNLYGMNYLLAGQLLFEIADDSYLKTTPEFQKALNLSTELSKKISMIKSVDAISILAKEHPFFSYMYYESLSQIVMLSSRDKKTRQLLGRGEFNADCYYGVIKDYCDISSNRFDASLFCPNQNELKMLLKKLSVNYHIKTNPEKVINGTLCNFNAIIEKLKNNGDIKKHLAGQFLKDTLKERDLVFLLCKLNTHLDKYRKENHINLIINCATFKPEIGIPAHAEISFFKKTKDGLKKLDLTYEKAKL